MNSVLEKDSVAYGIYAGCLEILLTVLLMIIQSKYLNIVDKLWLDFIQTLILALPLLLLGIFIKKSAAKAYSNNGDISGYELFTTGYTTGLVTSIVYASILWIAEFVILISEFSISSVYIDLFKITYSFAVVIGVGVIISIILSYFVYYLITHVKQVTYPSSFRRLPEPKNKKV